MRIVDAFAELESAVEAYLGKGNESVMLAAIFKLNNEVGKEFTLSQDPALKALQLRVNEVTVAAKKHDRKKLQVALERVRSSILDQQESE